MLLWKSIMKYSIALLSIPVLFAASGAIYAWSYPLTEVSKPKSECKSAHRDSLDDSCKMKLPIISNANYELYENDRIKQAIYSDIRGGSYNDGRDKDNGWAPSVDISTSEWTPIYAIGHGKVIFAGELKWYGKSITIEHEISKGKKVWSSYSHLSEINVKEWELVKEWVLIGKVGRTGFTIGQYGYHLDFAITTVKMKTFPYAYYDCKQWYMKAVQEWVCRDLMAKNTVDPILFLELWGDLSKTMKLAKSSVESGRAQKQLLAKSNKDSPMKKALDTAKLAVINEKIYTIKNDNLTIEIVDLKKDDNEVLKKWWKAYVTVVVKKNGKPYDGYLGKELAFVSKNKVVGIAWWTIEYVKWWEKTVILYGDKKGDDIITVMLDGKAIGTHSTKVG